MSDTQNMSAAGGALAAAGVRPSDSAWALRARSGREPRERVAWWLWWNVLSLDAPSVAVLWALLFARASGVRLSAAETFVLALSVWVIYVCDRLLDAWTSRDRAALPERHRFCFRHSQALAVALALAILTVLYLALNELPARESWSGVALGAVVAAYLVAIHGKAGFMGRAATKELIVGILFAAGTTLALWSRNANFFQAAWPLWTAFAVLCTLNCVSIEFWERPRFANAGSGAQRFPIAWVHSHFTGCALAIAALALLMALRHEVTGSSRQSLLAVGLGALGLLLIHANRSAFSRAALRVLADAALAIPALLFLVIYR